MSHLVNQDASQVVKSRRASRKGRVVKNDPIVFGVTRVVRREGGKAEETPGSVIVETDSVDVERVGTSLIKSVLHGSLLHAFWSDIVEPVRIRYPPDTLQVKTEASSGIFPVQDIDLFIDLRISEIY